MTLITDWPNKYPNCGKQPQSPILLDPTDSNLKRDLSRKIELIGYDQPVGLIVENTGHGSKFFKLQIVQ